MAVADPDFAKANPVRSLSGASVPLERSPADSAQVRCVHVSICCGLESQQLIVRNLPALGAFDEGQVWPFNVESVACLRSIDVGEGGVQRSSCEPGDLRSLGLSWSCGGLLSKWLEKAWEAIAPLLK